MIAALGFLSRLRKLATDAALRRGSVTVDGALLLRLVGEHSALALEVARLTREVDELKKELAS